jgi:hypothetical protein
VLDSEQFDSENLRTAKSFQHLMQTSKHSKSTKLRGLAEAI